MASLNKNPLKVKVALDTEAGGQKSWNSQLQSKLNAISASGKFSVQVSNIKIGAGAIADFKKQQRRHQYNEPGQRYQYYSYCGWYR